MILVFQAIWLVRYLGVIEHYSLPVEWIMRDPSKTKWPVLTHVSLPLVKRKYWNAVPENAKKATKSVVEITEWVYIKQIFFSILGWKRQNIYLAASPLGKYSAAIDLNFKEL